MRAMRKKLNISMFQLPIYYILKKEVSTCANTGIAKTKREKQVVFVLERWMQCLLLLPKSRSAREAAHHADFMVNCPTVSHRCLFHLPRRWVFPWCSWTKWARWVNLKFYLSISGLNQGECGREMSPRFPFITPGVWELPLRPNANKVT